MGMSGYALAKALHAGDQRHCPAEAWYQPRKRVAFCEVLLHTPEFWMNLQNSYELAIARKSLKKEIAKIRPGSAA